MRLARRIVLALTFLSLWAAAAGAEIGRTALGTGSGLLGGASITLGSNIAVGQGSTLVVFIEYDASVGLIAGISWNGAALIVNGTQGAVSIGASGAVFECWTLSNATAGTGDIVVNATGASPVTQWRATFTEITGALATSGSVDKFGDFASGTGPSPTSSGTGLRSQAKEMLLGCVALDTGTHSGTWQSGFTGGQVSEGGGYSLEDSYLSVASTGTLSARKTGSPNVDWGALVVSIRQAADTTATVYQRSISGRHRVRRRTP